MILGYVLTVLATLASGSGSVLESLGVRRAGAYGGTALALVALRRQHIYFLGIAVDLAGFACAAAALHRLPLFLVQSALAFSVGVTATISAFMGTRLASAGWVWLSVGAVGLVMLGVSAEPSPAQPLPPGWRWLLLGMAVPVTAVAWYTRHRGRSWATQVLAFCAGVGFCVIGVSARTLSIPNPMWRLVLEPSLWAMVVNGLAAAAVFAMALQRSGPTAVTAIMFTTNTILSSAVGLAYLDDHVRAGFVAVAATGFVLAITGAIRTAHHATAAHPPRSQGAPPSSGVIDPVVQ